MSPQSTRNEILNAKSPNLFIFEQTAMIRLSAYSLILALAALFLSCSASKKISENPEPHNLIIYYDPATGNKKLLNAAEKYGSEILYVYKNINGIAVTVPKGHTLREAVRYFESINGVLSVTEDRKMQILD